MKAKTKTKKTRIHDNWLAGYNGLEDATKASKKSPKKKSSKTKIYARLNSRPT